MTRRVGVALVGLAFAGVALGILAVRGGFFREPPRRLGAPSNRERGHVDPAALERLRSIPFYRAFARDGVVLACTLDGGGAVHVELDVRAIVGPHLGSPGLSDVIDLLPASARGTIVIAAQSVVGLPVEIKESWLIPGPATALAILDRTPPTRASTLCRDALPGHPAAVVDVRLLPSRLGDDSFGGAALARWRDRAALAEQLFGRPLRSVLAEDVSGPAAFALYDSGRGDDAEALLAVELRRSDRIAGWLDTLFGLGALTDRASIDRYRGVATGSFASGSQGLGVALAVDGPLLLVATSRARLESAIDARRSGAARPSAERAEKDVTASWRAVTASAFAARGWCRLARCPSEPAPSSGTMSASLRPEGASDWRLEGDGPAPAITADPVVPFLRSVLGRRQRGGD